MAISSKERGTGSDNPGEIQGSRSLSTPERIKVKPAKSELIVGKKGAVLESSEVISPTTEVATPRRLTVEDQKIKTLTTTPPFYPADEAIAEPLPLPKKKGMPRWLQNTILGATAFTTLWGGGAAAKELTNEKPVSAQTIRTDLAWPWDLVKIGFEKVKKLYYQQKELPAPEAFTNSDTPDSTIIKMGVNTSPITNSEVEDMPSQGTVKEREVEKPVKIDPTTTYINEIPGTIVALFPLKLTKDSYAETNSYYRNEIIGGSQQTEEKTKYPSIPIWKEINVYNSKGVEVCAGMLEGIGKVKEMMLFRNPYTDQMTSHNEYYFHGVTIRIITEKGVIYDLCIEPSHEDIRQLEALDIANNAPILANYTINKKTHAKEWTAENVNEKGLPIDPDTSLMRIAYNPTHILYSVMQIQPDKPLGKQFDNFGDIRWKTDGNSKLQYVSPKE